jgi:hypothetical protein
MEKTKVSIKDLNNYIGMVQGKANEHAALNATRFINEHWNIKMSYEFLGPDTITATIGKKYARVISSPKPETGSPESVHTFINLENGDILKAGSWESPQRNGVRGSIYAADKGASVVSSFGAEYLR